MGNFTKIFGLMAVLTALVMGVASIIGGTNALLPAFITFTAGRFSTGDRKPTNWKTTLCTAELDPVPPSYVVTATVTT